MTISDHPKRIQLSRAKGWRKPEGAVVVARPTKWGNPYVIGQRIYTAAGGHKLIKDRAMATDLFRQKAKKYMASYSAEIIRELRGKDLCCWCPLDQPCHADVLLELANAPISAVED